MEKIVFGKIYGITMCLKNNLFKKNKKVLKPTSVNFINNIDTSTFVINTTKFNDYELIATNSYVKKHNYVFLIMCLIFTILCILHTIFLFKLKNDINTLNREIYTIKTYKQEELL